MPPLSIIIPSYNQAPYIERTILSILKQDYPGDVQIIVSDGGSTDGTVDILCKYPQVRWWSERDFGIADGTNRGLTVATGEILAIQSSDDFYLPHAFTRTVECLERDGDIALASGCDIYLQPDGTTFTCSALDDHDVDPRSLLMRRVFPQHCTFFRREVVERIGLLRLDIEEGAEIDFWYRALHYFAGRFVPWHTAAYQLHPAQRTQTGRRWLASLLSIVQRNELDPDYGSTFRLDDEDKFNLYARWQIQTAAMTGGQDHVNQLLQIAQRDPRFTAESRRWLALHGFIPRPSRNNNVPRHPNHSVPDLKWWQNHSPRRAAA